MCCAVNHYLVDVVDSISKNYRYVVIDNQAGMEHLSRRTSRDLDHLLIVTDPLYWALVPPWLITRNSYVSELKFRPPAEKLNSVLPVCTLAPFLYLDMKPKLALASALAHRSSSRHQPASDQIQPPPVIKPALGP